MNEVRKIESQYGEFRCTLDNAGNIWFVGNDIANILGYKDQKMVMNIILFGLMKQDSILS